MIEQDFLRSLAAVFGDEHKFSISFIGREHIANQRDVSSLWSNRQIYGRTVEANARNETAIQRDSIERRNCGVAYINARFSTIDSHQTRAVTRAGITERVRFK